VQASALWHEESPGGSGKVTDMRRKLVLPSVCMLCADDGPGAGGRRTEAIAQIWIKMANDVIQKQYGNRRLVSLGL